MSIRSRLVVWFLRRTVKRRLAAMETFDRKKLTASKLRFPAPRGVMIERDAWGGLPGEWLEQEAPRATLLYLHGGGYIACSPQTHRPVTGAFAQRGFRVYVPDYRLAPEHPYPAALDDAVAVYRALLGRGVDPAGLTVAGESAGGGLALCLLVALRERGIPLPAAAALFSPWTDLAATGHSLVSNSASDAMFPGRSVARAATLYLGSADPRTPTASPLYADLAGLPPLLVHVGADEALLDDSTRLADRAQAAGVSVELKIWPAVPHGWQLFQRMMPEAARSVDEAARFLAARAGPGSPIASIPQTNRRP